MPRKKQAIHASGLVEVKATVGKTIDGKRIQKSFYGTSKLDAQKKADEYKLEQEVANRTGDTFIKKEYTFAEWAMRWLETYKKPNVSENTYRFTYENTVNKHLTPYFGKAKLTDIKPIDVQTFFTTKVSLSETMLDKMKLCLCDIFETAIDNDLCYKNPARKINYTTEAIKHQKQVYTKNQIKQVIKCAYNEMPEIIILLETGLRRGELLGLEWNDIDFKNKTLSVTRSVAVSKSEGTVINPPKWNSYRKIPLTVLTINLLKNLPKNNNYIFTNKENNVNQPNTWSQKLKRFMDSLPENIPRLTAHELRHTYGTNLRRNGVDIYTIQKVMGHKDIKMTSELYVHNEIYELKRAMRNTL